MSKGLAFWIIWLIALIFGGWLGYGYGLNAYTGGNLISMVLFFLLGWQVFGFPIQ